MAALRPGESILWLGRPTQPLVSWKDLMSLAPMTVLVWLWVRHRVDDGSTFWSVYAVAATALVLSGAALSLVRQWRVEYAVTSERVLIASRFPLSRASSMELAALDHVELERDDGGTGSLMLLESRLGLVPGISAPAPDPNQGDVRLDRIADAESVREIIERAKRDVARR